MPDSELDSFVSLIRDQFTEQERSDIHAESNLKKLREWSSLQTMIIVNEIDKKYNVILDIRDIQNSHTVSELFKVVKSKSV